MTDWIDFLVYAVFIASIFFVYPWSQTKLARPMLADRNANWAAENPETVRRMDRTGQWLLWLHYLFGIASLGALTTLQLGLWFPEQSPEPPFLQKWMVLWLVSMASLYIGILIFGSIGVVSYMLWKKNVPVAQSRQANLERRTIDDFIPLRVRLFTYLLVVAMLSAWSVVAILGWHDDPAFWARFVILIGLSAFFWLATSYAIGRRPNAMDRLFGPDYRRGEVWLTFSTQLLPSVIGAVRLYEEIANVVVFDINRAMFLGLALYIAAWMLWIGRQTAGAIPPAGGSALREPADTSMV